MKNGKKYFGDMSNHVSRPYLTKITDISKLSGSDFKDFLWYNRDYPQFSPNKNLKIDPSVLSEEAFKVYCETMLRIELPFEELRVDLGGTENIPITFLNDEYDKVNVDRNKVNIKWQIEDDRIASVDSKGVVKGISEGTTEVTATLPNGEEAYATIVVTLNLPDSEYKARYNKEMLRLVNAFRAENGVAPMEYFDYIQSAADVRAQEAIENPDLGHNRYDKSGKLNSFISVYEDLNLNFVCHGWGENLAWNYFDYNPEKMAKSIFTQWKNSDGHRRNMLNPSYTRFATAVVYDKNDSGIYQYPVSSVQLFVI